MTGVPANVEEKIRQLLKDESPEAVVVLKLGQKYEEKYGQPLKPDEYGFKSAFDMVKSFKEQVRNNKQQQDGLI
jgi:hypothetical protein